MSAVNSKENTGFSFLCYQWHYGGLLFRARLNRWHSCGSGSAENNFADDKGGVTASHSRVEGESVQVLIFGNLFRNRSPSTSRVLVLGL